jgi:hypothetical protein
MDDISRARYLAAVCKPVFKPRPAPVQHEQLLQGAIMKAIEASFPSIFVAHVPNWGKRSKTAAQRLKRAGVKRGVPDLVLILPDGRHAWLEVKHGKIVASSLSDEQGDFRDMCAERAIPWAVVNDVERALDYVGQWTERVQEREGGR